MAFRIPPHHGMRKSGVWIQAELLRIDHSKRIDEIPSGGVEQLSQRYGISPRQLQRICLQLFGIGPKDWLAALKMRAACRMIESGCAVKVVALELGFSSSAHFCSFFKERQGCSPESYRDDSDEHDNIINVT